ncbi:hypothetical protein [Acidiphilium sp. C61]|jgi:hypothetical protein|uniref:hypothetical protein n=1 Tax=Acidiphilium sp. C61 TaxID=1671485 RepID=UPI00157A9DBF|nr:hypothetical protein [Acidiphilium sp. C61]
MRRPHNIVFVFLIYAVAAISIFYRQGMLNGDVYFGTGGDPSLYIWMFRFLPQAIIHLDNPLILAKAWAPYGLNISQSTTTPGIALLAWPITYFFGPIVSFNIISILNPAFAATSAFLFCSLYTDKSIVSFLGGWIFGFSSYVFAAMIGHLQVEFIMFVPISFFAIGARSRNQISHGIYIFILSFSLIFQFLCSLEIFVMESMFLFLFLIFKKYNEEKNIKNIFIMSKTNIILGFFISYMISVLSVSPIIYIFFKNYNKIPHLLQDGSLYSTNLANLIIPTPITFIFGKWALPIAQRFSGNFSEEMGYIGLPLLLILIVAISSLRRVDAAKPLLVLLSAALLCTLGPELHVLTSTIIPLPWAVVGKLPFLDNALPSRLMLFVMLAISGLITLWIDKLAKHRMAAQLSLACAIIFTLPAAVNHDVDWWESHVPTARLFQGATYKKFIEKGKIVLFLPFGPTSGDAMFWQIETDGYFRMTNGYGNFIPPEFAKWPAARMLELGLHPPGFSSAFNDFTKAVKIADVIVPRKQLPVWQNAFIKAGWSGKTVGSMTVFRLPRNIRRGIPSVSSETSSLAFDRLRIPVMMNGQSVRS